MENCTTGHGDAMKHTKNPSHFQSVVDLAETGHGTFEDFEELYPESARGEIKARKRDLYYGRNVIWAGDHGRMIRVSPENIEHIWGNIFDADQLAAIVAGIRDADDRVIFYAPYGEVSFVEIQDIKESIEAFAHGDDDGMDAPLSTGDEDLDKWILDREEFIDDLIWDRDVQFEEYTNLVREMNERLQEAIDTNQGDLGSLRFQIRDGNHRAFGALLAGEPYIYMIVSDNQMQDLKDKNYKKTPTGRAILAALE